MTKKGIIYETLGSTAGMQIVESHVPGEVRLSGVFGVCGITNGNNRIYEQSNYGKMVGLMQERMKSESILGELEHPNTMNITLENVSHMIEDIQMNEDGTVTGTIRLLDTPKGQIAKAIIEGGAPLLKHLVAFLLVLVVPVLSMSLVMSLLPCCRHTILLALQDSLKQSLR